MFSKLFIFFIQAYRMVLSPFLGNSCRFYPSCSQYAIDVTRKYGFFKGLYLSLRRLFRCHPFHPGGYDPA